MGIEGSEFRSSGMYKVVMREVEDFARQLQTGTETDKNVAAAALKDLRKQALAQIAELREVVATYVTDSSIYGERMRTIWTDYLEKNEQILRAINVALGLEENNERPMN